MFKELAFAEAIELIVGEKIPTEIRNQLEGVLSDRETPEDISEALQDWANQNSAREINWHPTGGGILEAASLLVQRAIENGNIDRWRNEKERIKNEKLLSVLIGEIGLKPRTSERL